MASTTLRVSSKLRDRVNVLSRRANTSASDLLEAAVDAYEERLFWQQYAAARATDPGDPSESQDHELWERAVRTDRSGE